MIDPTKIPAVLRALPWEEPTTEDRFVFGERLLFADLFSPDEDPAISVVPVTRNGGFWIDVNAKDERRYVWNQDSLDSVIAFVRLDPPSE